MSRPANFIASRQDLCADLADADPSTVARTLALLGIPVFPVHRITNLGQCSCGQDCSRNAGKHPRTVNGLLAATRNLPTIRNWWHQWPGANVAVATGPDAGIWVLDIDPASQGEASLAALEAAYGELAPTWCVETGGGGFHLWFQYPGKRLQSSVGRLGLGLDVRADGGYVIVPPSCHRSGDRYRWATGWHPTLVDLAPAPTWLLDLVQRPASQKMIPPSDPSKEGKVGGNHSAAPVAAICEGARNATLTSLAGAMRRKGCSERAIVAALLVVNTERCQPQLPKAEIKHIAHSVCRYTPTPEARLVRASRDARTFVEFVDGKAVAR